MSSEDGASWTRVGSVAAGPRPWRELGGIVGERRPLLVGGAQDSEAGSRGRGRLPSLNASYLVRGPLQVCLSWARTARPCGREGGRAVRLVPSVVFGDRTWDGRSGVGRPRPARLRRRAAGQLCLGLGSPDICGLPSPPGLSAEWRVAGPLVCGGRREEIEEWF